MESVPDPSSTAAASIDGYRVEPGTVVDLDAFDPDDQRAFPVGKRAGKRLLAGLTDHLAGLQERLYAEGEQRLLLVLQAMDTGGKDGTIRHVFSGVNPQGVKVTSFKKPSAEELAHDYLWRVHDHTPTRGEIAIFNRSHYEDVLVVRVHDLVPEEAWRRRYRHINEFERMLADEGTTILKFFLLIGLDEQRERLQARLDDPTKTWKFNTGDLAERERWPEYRAAYEEAITETSTAWAPWYVVPANRKWYRNLVVSSALIAALERLDPRYPEPEPGLAGLHVE
jgi:PPK2 family polyphosphate:nucleotide phosphotransferase